MTKKRVLGRGRVSAKALWHHPAWGLVSATPVGWTEGAKGGRGPGEVSEERGQDQAQP